MRGNRMTESWRGGGTLIFKFIFFSNVPSDVAIIVVVSAAAAAVAFLCALLLYERLAEMFECDHELDLSHNPKKTVTQSTLGLDPRN